MNFFVIGKTKFRVYDDCGERADLAFTKGVTRANEEMAASVLQNDAPQGRVRPSPLDTQPYQAVRRGIPRNLRSYIHQLLHALCVRCIDHE